MPKKSAMLLEGEMDSAAIRVRMQRKGETPKGKGLNGQVACWLLRAVSD